MAYFSFFEICIGKIGLQRFFGGSKEKNSGISENIDFIHTDQIIFGSRLKSGQEKRKDYA